MHNDRFFVYLSFHLTWYIDCLACIFYVVSCHQFCKNNVRKKAHQRNLSTICTLYCQLKRGSAIQLLCYYAVRGTHIVQHFSTYVITFVILEEEVLFSTLTLPAEHLVTMSVSLFYDDRIKLLYIYRWLGILLSLPLHSLCWCFTKTFGWEVIMCISPLSATNCVLRWPSNCIFLPKTCRAVWTVDQGHLVIGRHFSLTQIFLPWKG